MSDTGPQERPPRDQGDAHDPRDDDRDVERDVPRDEGDGDGDDELSPGSDLVRDEPPVEPNEPG